jgi:uncharacterized protein involved in cysteine biosynthesis
MPSALLLATADLFAPNQRRVLLLSLGGALALLVALWFGATLLLQIFDLTGIGWLNRVLGILGSLAAIFLAWILFPAMSALMLGFFLNSVATAVERRHYPGLPPPRRQPIGEVIIVSLRLGVLAIVLNLVALPFYFWPVINLIVYYGLNGYVVGRAYFVLIALRRLDLAAANAMWRHYRLRLVLCGAAVAFVLSLPIIDLAAPVWAAALMLHLFEGLRAGTARPAGSLSGLGPT